ncbi:Competence protein TfoX [Paramixta manurensis]|uniref:Competence protein TfoX n=1 Tax=Paramixta manurensis TaxID=2740817 RepID=A0A6M8U7F6_9GAMM|nr:Competence protein TfoX [Erwiniaceae bacterium PD-1]
MNRSKQRIEQSKQVLSALGKIDARTQFGGYSLAVEKVIFAVVAEGELYLRACEQLKPYVVERQVPALVFIKRGMPVTLNYFRVDETLWKDPSRLLTLSSSSLQRARDQLQAKNANLRLKDLPNMGIRMETMLRDVGILTVSMLRAQGAKSCWLRLKAANKNIGVNILFALQGAISGHHQAALPVEVKKALLDWVELTTQTAKNK